mgnify:CR=1 FL=1
MTDRLLPEIGSGLPDNGRCGRARVIRLEEFSPAEPLHPRSREAFERRVLTLLDGGEAVRRGGFAEVRLVRNVWGEAFALKTPHLLDGATKAKAAVEDAFRREYQLFCRMSGIKGFPRVYGMGTVDGKLAILMEWVEGVPLGKAARILSVDDEGRMSPLAAARVGRDLFELLSRWKHRSWRCFTFQRPGSNRSHLVGRAGGRRGIRPLHRRFRIGADVGFFSRILRIAIRKVCPRVIRDA